MTKQNILSFLGKPVVSTVKRDAMAKGCTGIVVAVRTDNFDSGDYVFCVDVTKTTTAYLHEFDMMGFGGNGAGETWKFIENPPHSLLDNCYYLFCPGDLSLLTND